jgi:hypothetical protein
MNKFATALPAWAEARASRTTTRFAPKTEVWTLANFVRTFELNSNISSHDWHVQPSCQRPKSHLRLSGAFSVRSGSHKANPSVLETFQKYRPACATVNPCSAQDFHTAGGHGFQPCRTQSKESVGTAEAVPFPLYLRSKTHLPSRSSADFGQKLTISARAESEDDSV